MPAIARWSVRRPSRGGRQGTTCAFAANGALNTARIVFTTFARKSKSRALMNGRPIPPQRTECRIDTRPFQLSSERISSQHLSQEDMLRRNQDTQPRPALVKRVTPPRSAARSQPTSEGARSTRCARSRLTSSSLDHLVGAVEGSRRYG
jgi:hypothetical protein